MTHYLLTGQLEAGELAELYAATRDGEPVEIKLFHPQTSDVRYAQELADTARVLSTIPSENIARFLDIGLIKGRLAVVREHAEGLTVGAALQRLGTKEVMLPFQVALTLMIALLETVQQVHDAGVIHGAITPGNVTLHPEGHAVIWDFGALRALQAVPALKKNFSNRGRNTYRAPEVSAGEAPTELSDLYSLGAIAYELLTLREPVAPGGGGNVSTRRETLPAPSRVDRRLNGRLDPIIMRALDPLPNRRFRSCGELSSALRNFLANNGGMPLREDVQRVMRELISRAPPLGPVPFTEPFTLAEVEGADLPELNERSRVIDMRPSFSGSEPLPPDAETMEAAPAFEEYREDTDPSKAGPLEQGWVAPPGLAPTKTRRSMSMPSQPAAGTRPPARNPRMKVMEDYSFVGPAPKNPFEDEDRTDRTTMRPDHPEPGPAEPPPRSSGARPAPPLPPPPPIAASEPPPSGEQPPSPWAAAPPKTSEEVPLALPRRGPPTSLIFLLLAFGAVFCFAVALIRMVSNPGQPSEFSAPLPGPAPRSEESPSRRVEEPKGPLVPVPIKPAPVPPPVAPAPVAAPKPTRTASDDYTADEPPDRREAAFLTLLSDAPASVSIDGMRVHKRTPLFRYPVHPGDRRITLESLITHERKEFTLSFEKGKLRRVEERFKKVGSLR